MTTSRGDDKRPIDRVQIGPVHADRRPRGWRDLCDDRYGNGTIRRQGTRDLRRTVGRPTHPGRTNVTVPNTQQRLLSIGTHDPEVARIFLTAYTMFKSMHLGASFPEREAWSLAFEFLRDIVAMMEIHSALGGKRLRKSSRGVQRCKLQKDQEH